jgi:uncharacterized Tic20 family protein
VNPCRYLLENGYDGPLWTFRAFPGGIPEAILSIVGAVKASNEEVHQSPLTIRLVK